MSDLIPKEAYNYFPSGEKLFISSGRSIVRYIFYNTEFTQYELTQLSEFKQYLESTKTSIPDEIRLEEVLRAIIGCKFNFKKSLEAINSAIRWKLLNMPQGIDSLYTKAEILLNSGSIYIHGRDHRYRPLIILNAGKLDLDKYTSEDYCNLLCFTLEYCIRELMVPGHIENWIIITDLNQQSLGSLPISELKTIIKTLQDNFRCRMIVNYIVNAPRSLRFIWTVIKGFIETHTVNKIRILREGKPAEMNQNFAPHQYEDKYGGTSPNLTTQFWPPTLPNGPFEAPGETPGAHLDLTRTLEVPLDHSEEIFYSFARSTIDHSKPFQSFRKETLESRNTVYTDVLSRHTVYSDAVSTVPESTINPSNEPLLPPPKSKKCCKGCSIF